MDKLLKGTQIKYWSLLHRRGKISQCFKEGAMFELLQWGVRSLWAGIEHGVELAYCQLLQQKKVTGDFNDMHKNLNFVPLANGIMECLMLENDMVRFVLRKACRGVWQRDLKGVRYSLEAALDGTVLIACFWCFWTRYTCF